MIPEKQQSTVVSNMDPTTAIEMVIDQKDMPFVMGALTNLYSDKITAILREYATNAFDAMVAAGIDPLVEVTLPTVLNPVLKIRDRGIGLAQQDIATVYAKYGASTKRESNAFNGQLGLGGKSALTYGEQFTVTSVKDGTKIVVVVSRSPEGGGSMNVVGSAPTDEPNGTEVAIPVQAGDYHAFQTKAAQAYQWFPAGTVSVDGETPATYTERMSPQKITDSLYVTRGTRASRVVMGNVAYPAPELDGVLPNGSLLAFVPIGTVEFTPAREGLRDTPGTVAKLKEIRTYAAEKIAAVVQADIDAQATPQDALSTLAQWEAFIPKREGLFTYKGRPIVDSYDSREPVIDPDTNTIAINYQGNPVWQAGWRVADADYYGGRKANSQNGISREAWSSTLFVLNFPKSDYNKGHKTKLRALMEQRGIAHARRFALTTKDKLPPSPAAFFIDRAMVVDWLDAKKIVITPRERAYSSRIPGSYDIMTEAGLREGVPGDEIRQDKPIYYASVHQYRSSYRSLLSEIHPNGWTLVKLGENRVAKFLRNVPQTKEVYGSLVEYRNKWLADLTEKTKTVHAMRGNEIGRTLSDMDEARVDDPELKGAIQLAATDITAFQRMLNVMENAGLLRRHYETRIEPKTEPEQASFGDYPFWSTSAFRRNPDHMYDYLNWVYAGRKA